MAVNTDLEHSLSVMKRGAVDIFPEKEFASMVKKSCESGKALRIKLGVDPTASDLHLGFTVVLRKMRQFQDLGHQAVLIIGDYTAMVGDPSGRSSTRPVLSHEEVMKNAENFLSQASVILDREKLEVVYNGAWFSKMNFGEVMKLAGRITVAKMLEREDFKSRYTGGTPISLHEFFYPLMQGWDSVEIKADIELGGTDQRFNIAVGRDLQEGQSLRPQTALLMPILPGLDGVNKMSKSLGNTVGMKENARDQFGKLMSIPDSLMSIYYELLTDFDMEEVKKDLSGRMHPRDAKIRLASDIVTRYHGAEAAAKEIENFSNVFSKGEIPAEMPDLKVTEDVLWIVDLCARSGALKSNSEIRRLIEGGGVSIDGEKISDVNAKPALKDGQVLKMGKRSFFRIRKN